MERKDATIKFWKEALPQYKVYVTEITVKELDATRDETLRKRLRKLIKDFKILKFNNKIRDLAKAYIERCVFPEIYIDDALHVAITTYYEISYLVLGILSIWLRLRQENG